MNKTTTYAIVGVIVIVIVIGVAAYALLGSPGGGGPTPTPTPTAPPSDVAEATTLRVSANVTSQGTTTEYKWQGVNIHSTNAVLRLDFDVYGYVMNASSQESWNTIDGGTTWTEGDFTVDWPIWGPYWTELVDNLTHWNGSDETYTFTNKDGDSVLAFNIEVNPTIPDSTFAVG